MDQCWWKDLSFLGAKSCKAGNIHIATLGSTHSILLDFGVCPLHLMFGQIVVQLPWRSFVMVLHEQSNFMSQKLRKNENLRGPWILCAIVWLGTNRFTFIHSFSSIPLIISTKLFTWLYKTKITTHIHTCLRPYRNCIVWIPFSSAIEAAQRRKEEKKHSLLPYSFPFSPST